ncbi:hypothetical protein P4133_08300 [Pseudomonas aeruginosa]|nr:hypothetical protein [Pseudomonas aeruginosa]
MTYRMAWFRGLKTTYYLRAWPPPAPRSPPSTPASSTPCRPV